MSKSIVNSRYLDELARDYFRSMFNLNGAEEDEGEEDSQGTGKEGAGVTTSSGAAATTTEAKTKTYTHEEVEALIAESKNYRKRAQAAEAKLSEHEKAQMSELERAKAEVEEQKGRAAKAEAMMARMTLETYIKDEATAQNFANPADVVAFLNIEDIKVDDGKPDTNSLKAAVKRIATDKPYLIKGATTPGSGDGGSRGGHATDKSTEYDKEYQSRGMVPIGR